MLTRAAAECSNYYNLLLVLFGGITWHGRQIRTSLSGRLVEFLTYLVIDDT